jgi:uncharacterized protein YerC
VTRDDQVAALLEAGATHELIMRRLGVSNTVIRRVRAERDIPLPPGRAKRPRSELDALEAQAIAMMLAGAGTKEIYEELRLSLNTIAELRRELNLPAPRQDVWSKFRRSVDEAFARYARPADGGHLLWTGPHSGRGLDLIASGRRYNARHVAFLKHHGREPVGRVFPSDGCRVKDCIAGAHHTDAVMRGTAEGTT